MKTYQKHRAVCLRRYLHFSNSTEITYTGWPDRLYVIDRDGRVAYRSKPGPFGFRPQELGLALKQLVP